MRSCSMPLSGPQHAWGSRHIACRRPRDPRSPPGATGKGGTLEPFESHGYVCPKTHVPQHLHAQVWVLYSLALTSTLDPTDVHTLLIPMSPAPCTSIHRHAHAHAPRQPPHGQSQSFKASHPQK